MPFEDCRKLQDQLEGLSREPVGVDMICFVADATRRLLASWAEQAPDRDNYNVALEGCVLGGFRTLELFLFHLVVSSGPSTVVFMSILVYISRLGAAGKPMAPTTKTAYKVVLSSLIIAFKVIEDPRKLAKSWSWASQIRVSNISLGFDEVELAGLEIQLGTALDWKLHISRDDLCREVTKFLAARKATISANSDRMDFRSYRKLLARTFYAQVLKRMRIRHGGNEAVENRV
jgi:hypothetical protein